MSSRVGAPQAERIARWDRFCHPEPLPTYAHGFPTIWWWDADKVGEGRSRAVSGGVTRRRPELAAPAPPLTLMPAASPRAGDSRRSAHGPRARPACTGCRSSASSNTRQDFKHFDYVNADRAEGRADELPAAQLGLQPVAQTFNTLNTFVLKGDAPPRIELIFDTLMAGAGDEPDAIYGLVAETVDVSADGNVSPSTSAARRASTTARR